MGFRVRVRVRVRVMVRVRAGRSSAGKRLCTRVW